MGANPVPIDIAKWKYSGAQVAFEGFEPPGKLVGGVTASASGRVLGDHESSFQGEVAPVAVNRVCDADVELLGAKAVQVAQVGEDGAFTRAQCAMQKT